MIMLECYKKKARGKDAMIKPEAVKKQKKIDSNETSEQKCRIKTNIKNSVITLRKMFGYPLSTLSNSSKPNVRVISLMPCNQYGCSPFVSWHKS